MQVRLDPTQVKHLLAAPIPGRLVTLPTNIRLGWKDLPGTSTLAYYELSQITVIKSFKTLGPGANVMKLFTAVIYKYYS